MENKIIKIEITLEELLRNYTFDAWSDDDRDEWTVQEQLDNISKYKFNEFINKLAREEINKIFFEEVIQDKLKGKILSIIDKLSFRELFEKDSVWNYKNLDMKDFIKPDEETQAKMKEKFIEILDNEESKEIIIENLSYEMLNLLKRINK